MAAVFAIWTAIWLAGWRAKVPHSMRWALIGIVYAAVVLAQLALPQDASIRRATGGGVGPWLGLGAVAAVIYGYAWIVRRLRARAQPELAQVAQKSTVFSETELNRYARHIVLREIGGTGQKALRDAKVLVVGAGGLGAPVLQYLAASGVGTIGVIDDDLVENANLQRQVIHKDAAIGTAKVFSAQKEMQAQNPFVTVRPYNRRLTDDIAAELLAEYDLVLDGTDNFETRYLVNRTCVAGKLPLVSGALSQWEGQVSVFDPANGTPCYQCIFPQAPAPELAPSCAEAGVLGPLPGVVGAMMAAEAVKLITGAGTPLRGQLVIYDALHGESRSIAIKPRGDCPTCGHMQSQLL